MQKEVSSKCIQNEYTLHKTAICSRLWVVFCEIHCVLVLNAVHFGAKHSAFWCKTQRILVQNAVHFGAKRKMFWC